MVPDESLMPEPLEPGTRVRVIRDANWPGPWPSEPLGVIEPLMGEPFREINLATMGVNVPDAEKGPTREYMVMFDEPQLDADGDGPYRAAVIWQKYLQPVGWVGVDQSPEALAARAADDAAIEAVLEHPERGQRRD